MGINRVRCAKFAVLVLFNVWILLLLVDRSDWPKGRQVVRPDLLLEDSSASFQHLESKNFKQQIKLKTILFWNGPRRSEMTIFGTGHDVFVQHRCPVSDCEIVNSPYQYPDRSLDTFDAIVINFNDEFWLKKRPEFDRRPEQRLVFFTQEPPPSIQPINITSYTDYFNWTMTYRRDSDIRLLYGRIRPKLSAPKTPEEIRARINATNSSSNTFVNPNHRKRRRLVAAMISHCTTDGRREIYIKNLKKYLKVDVYGACRDNNNGRPPLTCDTNELLSSTPECYDVLENKYMFYLSFENAICTDYVTEKFFQIMKHHMVPVVYGGADYEQIAPPHSYIDARHFKPKELADYLRLLASNRTLYEQYFWWKEDYMVEAGLESMTRHGFCDLCQKLHEDNRSNKFYPSLAEQWDPEVQCHRPNITKKRVKSNSRPWFLPTLFSV